MSSDPVIISLIALSLSALTTQASAPADLFEKIYAKGKARQQAITSIGASFTETTESSLLTKPIVARGTLIAARPSRMVMKYAVPEEKTVIVDGDWLIVTWATRPEREKVNIAQVQARVDKYFATASPNELRASFEIVASADTSLPNTYKIDMKPKRKQIREGLERLQIWIDRDSSLMVRMRMELPGGDSKTLDLENVTPNVPIDASTFRVPQR
jgi:outer membrane lipoprotein-sorting protein